MCKNFKEMKVGGQLIASDLQPQSKREVMGEWTSAVLPEMMRNREVIFIDDVHLQR